MGRNRKLRMTVPSRNEADLHEKLGAGSGDDISRAVRIGGQQLYVVLNRRLNYIGISTLQGPTRFFAQGEEATEYIEKYDKLGAKKFVNEMNGYGFW